MNLLVEAVERRGSSLEHEFPINSYDLREIFDRLGEPADWLKPVVIQYEPETRVVQIEKKGPNPPENRMNLLPVMLCPLMYQQENWEKENGD